MTLAGEALLQEADGLHVVAAAEEDHGEVVERRGGVRSVVQELPVLRGIALHLAEIAGLKLPLARATKSQYDRMIFEGLGELDKSGIAELTFKGRLPND